MSYFFQSALLPEGWQHQVRIKVDSANGSIASLQCNASPEPGDLQLAHAIPGFINAHSHAFQRGFTGLSEYRSAQQDSFWTWRKLMYDFVDQLTPESLYQIARQLYQDMLRAGYSSVCEFHYVHTDPQGQLYDDPAELANAMVRAADDCGLAICILPVLYQRGGFANEALESAQRRFYLAEETYLEMVHDLQKQWSNHANVSVGIAFHSLRAVKPDVMRRVLGALDEPLVDCPIHIHIAEQLAEVEQCLAHHQQRPVEFLFNSFDVDDRWCLIHATHMTPKEVESVASSQATVGVCPTTEANLGDGVFSADSYLIDHQGRLAIGSDSNIALDPFSELRLLEYAQRLTQHRRAVLCTEDQSVGRFLCEASWKGQSISGFATGQLAVGQRADILAIDPHDHCFSELTGDRLLDYAMFNENQSAVQATLSGGHLTYQRTEE